MLYDLHRTATAYFTYLRGEGARWDDASATRLRNQVVDLATAAGVDGVRFQRFTAKIAAQVASR